MVDVSAELAKQSNTDVRMFARIMSYIQKQYPKIEDLVPPDWLVISTHLDIHEQVVIAALADVDEQLALKSTSPLHWARRIPTAVRAYDLVHDDSNATGFTFDSEMAVELKAGAGIKTDGASWQVIADNDWFDVNDVVFAAWLYLPATEAQDTIDQIIYNENGVFKVRIEPHATAANQIKVHVTVSSVAKEVTFVYTPDTWFSIMVHADATNITVWADNVQQDITATGGVKDTGSGVDAAFQSSGGAFQLETAFQTIGAGSGISLWAGVSGTNPLKSGSLMAFVTIADKDITADSAWRSDYQIHILDYEDASDEEITTFPFIQDFKAEPNSHSGFFYG